jgi:hypothetical protein
MEFEKTSSIGWAPTLGWFPTVAARDRAAYEAYASAKYNTSVGIYDTIYEVITPSQLHLTSNIALRRAPRA